MDVTNSSRSISPPAGADPSKPMDECANVGTFKNIPVRMYRDSQLLSLKLVKPTKVNEGVERLTTLQDLVNDYFPSEDNLRGEFVHYHLLKQNLL